MSKAWNGIHHRNTNRTDGEYCARCGKPIERPDLASLELNACTGKYRSVNDPAFPEDESQGWFSFGKTCAKRTLKEQAA